MAKKGSKFNKYTKEFKLEVVQAYLSNEYGGFEQVAKKFSLPDKSRVQDWLRLYNEKGSNAFQTETRGKGRSGKSGRPKLIKLEEMSLEEQNQYLRMENDILKKVQALLKD